MHEWQHAPGALAKPTLVRSMDAVTNRATLASVGTIRVSHSTGRAQIVHDGIGVQRVGIDVIDVMPLARKPFGRTAVFAAKLCATAYCFTEM
jgi:hypothetical protein